MIKLILFLVFTFQYTTAFTLNPSPIPVVRSLVHPQAIVDLLVTHYNWKETPEVHLLSQGDNDIYLISSGLESYIFRLSRHQKHWLDSKDNYLFEMEWLNFLHSHNLPVSYPIPQLQGDYIGELRAPEGIRYWALFTWADGTPYMETTRAEIFGKSIAEIHLVSDYFKAHHTRHHLNLEFLLDKPLNRIEQALAGSYAEELSFLKEELLPRLIAPVRAIPSSGSEYGPIGGDFHGYNQHFTDNNEITHFDFDLCGYGWRAYDLAIFRWSRGSDQQLWEAFLKGYESVRPLNPLELEAISAFIVIRHIWLMGSYPTYPDAVLNGAYWRDSFQELRHLAENLH